MSKSFAFEFDKPRFFMGEKILPLKNVVNVPGPGVYNPKTETIKKTMPSFSMKIKLESTLVNKNIKSPGPVNY